MKIMIDYKKIMTSNFGIIKPAIPINIKQANDSNCVFAVVCVLIFIGIAGFNNTQLICPQSPLQ